MIKLDTMKSNQLVVPVKNAVKKFIDWVNTIPQIVYR